MGCIVRGGCPASVRPSVLLFPNSRFLSRAMAAALNGRWPQRTACATAVLPRVRVDGLRATAAGKHRPEILSIIIETCGCRLIKIIDAFSIQVENVPFCFNSSCIRVAHKLNLLLYMYLTGTLI